MPIDGQETIWRRVVVFSEDASQANTGHAAENLVMFRRMAQALIKQDVGVYHPKG